MGIYNCASTLREALDSLYAQTFTDFKIIMCDDGSVDDTFNVAKEYESKYGNVILLKNEKNIGLNATLNRCLKMVDTPYVARMDGDDISLPDRFETEINFLDRHPEYAFVSASMICFDEKGPFKTLYLKEGSPEKKDFVKTTPFFHAPVMVRTSAYYTVRGYTVDPRLLRVEDYHLWFKMYAAGLKGYNLSQPLYKMRDDKKATSRRNWNSRKNEMYVKWIGYRMLNLPIYLYPWILTPFLKFLIPTQIYERLHRK